LGEADHQRRNSDDSDGAGSGNATRRSRRVIAGLVDSVGNDSRLI